MIEAQKVKMVKAYQVFKSVRKVASIFKISYGAAHAVLKQRNALLPWSGFKRVKRWTGGNKGPVSRWLERHPTAVLKGRDHEIAALIGCTPTAVHSWRVARYTRLKTVTKKIIPKAVVKKLRFSTLEVELVDGTLLAAEEVFQLEKKMKEKGK